MHKPDWNSSGIDCVSDNLPIASPFANCQVPPSAKWTRALLALLSGPGSSIPLSISLSHQAAVSNRAQGTQEEGRPPGNGCVFMILFC